MRGDSLANRELKQATFLTTRTLTGSKFDVFYQSRRLIQSSWRPCCQKRRLLKLSNSSRVRMVFAAESDMRDGGEKFYRV